MVNGGEKLIGLSVRLFMNLCLIMQMALCMYV